MLSTMSGLMIESPSCCPERTSIGRYTSTPFIYTQFSSNEPPRTLYCEDSSLWVDTPACVAMISSMALPVVEGMSFVSGTAMRSVEPSRRACALTTASPNSCMPNGGSTTSMRTESPGERTKRLRVS